MKQKKSQNTTSAPEPVLAENSAPKKPRGLIIATITASVIALISVVFTIVTLIEADKKSAEISELAAKVDLLQRKADTQLVATVTAIEPRFI